MSNLPSYEIPAIQELARYKSWVIWNDKKIPYTDYSKPADTTASKTWCSFDAACSTLVGTKVIRNPQGVGFVFSEADPFVGIDIDNCLDGDGKIKDWAKPIVDALDSYTEKSPSRRGLHVIVRADLSEFLSGHKNKTDVGDGKLEIYHKERYFTVTGWCYGNYSEEIFDRAEELKSVAEQFMPKRDKVSEVKPYSGGEIDYRLSKDAEPPEAKKSALIENDKMFERTWNYKRPEFSSQNEYEMSLMMFAVIAQWEPHECAALITAHRRRHNPEKLDKMLRYDYIDRTYRKAKAAVSDGVDERDAYEFSAINSSIEAGRDETIAMLSSKLGVEFEGAVRRGREDTQYYLKIGGQEIMIGGSDNLMSVTKVRAKLFNVTGKPIKAFKSPLWMKIVEAIYAVSEYQDIADSSRVEEINCWISDYISSKNMMTGEDWREGAVSKTPFEKDEEIYIYPDKLREYLRHTKDVRIDIGPLKIRLKEAGWDSTQVSARARGTRIQRYFWRIPKKCFKMDDDSDAESGVEELQPSDFGEAADT